MFGIERDGLPVLLQRSAQIAGFFERSAFVVQLKGRECGLAFLVDLAQQSGQFVFDLRRFIQFSVLA